VVHPRLGDTGELVPGQAEEPRKVDVLVVEEACGVHAPHLEQGGAADDEGTALDPRHPEGLARHLLDREAKGPIEAQPAHMDRLTGRGHPIAPVGSDQRVHGRDLRMRVQVGDERLEPSRLDDDVHVQRGEVL